MSNTTTTAHTSIHVTVSELFTLSESPEFQGETAADDNGDYHTFFLIKGQMYHTKNNLYNL